MATKRDIEKRVSRQLANSGELEGWVFIHVACVTHQDKVLVSKSYFVVKNSVCYSINGGKETMQVSGDDLFSVYAECEKVALYDGVTQYKRYSKWFKHSELAKKLF